MDREPGSYTADKDGGNLRPNLKDPAMKARHELNKKAEAETKKKSKPEAEVNNDG